MKQRDTRNLILFLLFSFITHSYSAEKSSLFSSFSSLSKKEKIIVIVTGGIVITYAVYKIGEHTVKTVKSVYQQHQKRKLEQLSSKAKKQSKELAKNAQDFTDTINSTEQDRERDIDYLRNDNQTSEEQLSVMEGINQSANSTTDLVREAYAKNQKLINLRNALLSHSKTTYNKVSDYSEQKKILKEEEEKDVFQHNTEQNSHYASLSSNMSKGNLQMQQAMEHKLNRVNELIKKNKQGDEI